MPKTSKKLDGTKQLMAALVGMKPKPHEELVGKPRAKKKVSPKKKATTIPKGG